MKPSKGKPVPFIILDRDGVINYESHEYIKSPEEWLPIPGSLEAIATLNQAGYQVLIATNQSGLARGYFDLAMLEKIHAKLHAALHACGGTLTEIFFCPHHPADGCFCRKPQPGLFFQIRDKYALELKDVFFVGDSLCDVQAAKNAGCKPLLVLTGNGQKTRASYTGAHLPVFQDLAQVAEFVLHEK